MMVMLMLAAASACLGFLACALLTQSRMQQTRQAYLTLASAVYDFTGRHSPIAVPAQVTDLFVPPETIGRLQRALDESRRWYSADESRPLAD
jgi:hypothetical protein